MKFLFLCATFFSLIVTVHAQRQFNQYTCEITHKYADSSFYLKLNTKKEVDVGGWNVHASLTKIGNEVEISLMRVVSVIDATYKKESVKRFPLNAKDLHVELEHSFGGSIDLFNMNCSPRDP